jgi:DNA ligase-associated metallophosphoesterase
MQNQQLRYQQISVRQHRFRLYPDKAVYWEAEEALLIADLHLGKSATFRAAGIGVPGGSTSHDLILLGELLNLTQSRSLYILGDFFHAKAGLTAETIKQFSEWRQSLHHLDIVLIKGNHDRFAVRLPAGLGIDRMESRVERGDILLQHTPEIVAGKYVLAGHLHPAVQLFSAGRIKQKLPCFFFGKEYAILPAFGSMTGTATIKPREGDRIFVIAEDEVIPVPVKLYS